MAKLIYSAVTSLDGYVADETGNFDRAAPDEEFTPSLTASRSWLGRNLLRGRAKRNSRYDGRVNDLEGAGYALADLVLADHQCEHIAHSIPAVTAGRGGVRNLIAHPTVMRLLGHEALSRYLWSVVGRDMVAVKATLFDKTVESNWRVQWHQDRAVAVRERMNVAGYGPWSSKSGTLHVEPPAEVLAQMLAVRIHLDRCGSENGPLRVIPGTHVLGKLAESQISEVVASHPMVELYVPQGAILLMRPLLVHSSVPARDAAHRRILHVEFAPLEAISPLHWHTAISLWRAPDLPQDRTSGRIPRSPLKRPA